MKGSVSDEKFFWLPAAAIGLLCAFAELGIAADMNRISMTNFNKSFLLR